MKLALQKKDSAVKFATNRLSCWGIDFRWVWRNQQAVILMILTRVIPISCAMKVLSANGLKSYCCIPLTVQRSKWRNDSLSKKRNAYVKIDTDFYKRLGGTIAVALDQALRLQESKILNAALEKRIPVRKNEFCTSNSITRHRKLQKALMIRRTLSHHVDMESDLICRYLPDTHSHCDEPIAGIRKNSERLARYKFFAASSSEAVANMLWDTCILLTNRG